MTKRSKMKLLLSKTGETTDSKIEAESNPKDQGNAAIDTTPETETTGTGTGSTVSNARSRTTCKKNAGSELKTINHAKTNKDGPTGLKCM
jgi:pectate lyase